MRREQFYTLVIILLLLLNFGTLGYLWISRNNENMPAGHPPERPDNIIINELQLDDKQQMQFQGFKHRHRRATDSVQEQISGLQKELFALVEQDSMDLVRRDSLLKQIEGCESAKHLITIQHFHEIRSILRPEQKQLFNEFMGEIGSRITGPGKRGHHPPPLH